MRRLLNIQLVVVLLGVTISGFAQNDVKNMGVSIKLFTGPQFFLQKNVPAPMPMIGLKAALVLNTTELEFGYSYVPKLWGMQNPSGTNGYTSIALCQHYSYGDFNIHQKLFKFEKHLFSISLGIGILYCMNQQSDTTMNDGSHSYNLSVTYKGPVKKIGCYLGFGFRYSYQLNPKTVFFLAPFFNFKVIASEFTDPNTGGHGGGMSPYPGVKVPETDFFSTGLMIGIHWMFPFVKDAPPNFFKENKKKEKG